MGARSFEEVEKFLRKQKKLEGVSENEERIKTGLPGLDYILGGGIPIGRVFEIYGFEDCGKTTLAYTIGRAIQQEQSRRFCLWDYEHATDRTYLEACGVDTSKDLFKWEQPSCLEHGMDSLTAFIETGDVGVAIIDSVASMLPLKELKGEMGDQDIALQARLISKALRSLVPLLGPNETTLIVISHLKETIGAFKAPTCSTGGRALKFYSSVRIEMRTIKPAESFDSYAYTIGKVIKNKTTSKLKDRIKFPIGSSGIDPELHVLECLKDYGVVKARGASRYLDDERLCKGDKALLKKIRESPEEFVEALENRFNDNSSERRRDNSTEGLEEEDDTLVFDEG